MTEKKRDTWTARQVRSYLEKHEETAASLYVRGLRICHSKIRFMGGNFVITVWADFRTPDHRDGQREPWRLYKQVNNALLYENGKEPLAMFAFYEQEKEQLARVVGMKKRGKVVEIEVQP